VGAHNLFYAGTLALRVLYALRDLAVTPAELGGVYAVAMVGPLLAAVVAGPVTRRFGGRWAPVVATAMFAPGVLFPLAGGPHLVVLALLVIAWAAIGLGAVFLQIVRSTVLQQTVPAGLQGRVNAVMHVVEWGALPVGSLAGGILGQAFGLRPTLLALAVAGVAASLPWVLVPAIRNRFPAIE
jgi:MFS family permease